MKDPFQNLEFDRDELVLGLLLYCFTYRLDPDNANLVQNALRRLYPGCHNVGHIECLMCLDMGVICSQCEAFPHSPLCKNIKGTPMLQACHFGCEASGRTEEILKSRKIMDLTDKVRELEKQLAEATARLGDLRS